MSKLKFSSSVAILLSGNRRLSVPALPYSGQWAVTKAEGCPRSVSHTLTGMSICYCRNLRVGRVIVTILDRMPYDFSLRAGQQDFKKQNPEIYQWLKKISWGN